MRKVKRLRRVMFEKDATIKDTAKLAGLSPSTLTDHMAGHHPFTAAEMKAITKVLGLKPDDCWRYFVEDYGKL